MSDKLVTASVLLIGNEILSGRTEDKNLNHIALTLAEWGIQVREARVIPDVVEIIVDSVRAASATFDYVFTTGGIGPTHDDITADCVAQAFDKEIIEHPEIASVIRRRPAPEDVMASRLRMARVPEGSRLIDNPTGGPQGFAIENVYVMAGIPMVMRAMLSTLQPHLESGPVVRSRSVTAYMGESQIAEDLRGIQSRYPDVDLGSYPFFRDDRYGTSLVMRGVDEAALDSMLDEIKALITRHGETPADVASS